MSRSAVIAGLLAAPVLSGCAGPLEAGDGAPVDVSLRAVRTHSDGLVTLTVGLRNPGAATVTLRMRCTPLELEQEQAGSWVRIEDLRLCAPPDRMLLPGRSSIEVQDQRLLSPGRYRVVVEAIDGALARSEPFAIPAA